MGHPTIIRATLPLRLRPGLYWPRPGGDYVLVHDGLHPAEERSVIAHEIAHHRRGGGIARPWMPRTWDAVVAREESACDRDAAADLIPVEQLSAWMDEALNDIEAGIGPDDVAGAFGVTRRIAAAALDNLTRWERGR